MARRFVALASSWPPGPSEYGASQVQDLAALICVAHPHAEQFLAFCEGAKSSYEIEAFLRRVRTQGGTIFDIVWPDGVTDATISGA
jgi:hypothetical protein